MKILLFIPCYNCAPQISRTIAQLTPEIRKYFAHVLVVDNGSTDNTLEAAEQALTKLGTFPGTLVRNTHNYHLGGSHKVAFEFARQHGFSHVCVLHGDDQGALSDVIPYLPAVAQDETVSWLGSRFMWGSRLKGYSWARILGNIGFNVLFSVATGRWLTDLGSGLNLFSLKGLERVPLQGFGDNLMFNYYLILSICQRKAPYRFFPISWREDDQISNVKLFGHGKKTLALLWQFVKNREAFVNTDHRATRHTAYSWDDIYTTELKKAKAA